VYCCSGGTFCSTHQGLTKSLSAQGLTVGYCLSRANGGLRGVTRAVPGTVNVGTPGNVMQPSPRPPLRRPP